MYWLFLNSGTAVLNRLLSTSAREQCISVYPHISHLNTNRQFLGWKLSIRDSLWIKDTGPDPNLSFIQSHNIYSIWLYGMKGETLHAELVVSYQLFKTYKVWSVRTTDTVLPDESAQPRARPMFAGGHHIVHSRFVRLKHIIYSHKLSLKHSLPDWCMQVMPITVTSVHMHDLLVVLYTEVSHTGLPLHLGYHSQ